MKKIKVNESCTVGELQFNSNDTIVTIGTFCKTYLLEALRLIDGMGNNERLTLGTYNANNKRQYNMLCVTDGDTVVCVAPIWYDDDSEYNPTFPYKEGVLTDHQKQLCDEVANQVGDETFKQHIIKLLNIEA